MAPRTTRRLPAEDELRQELVVSIYGALAAGVTGEKIVDVLRQAGKIAIALDRAFQAMLEDQPGGPG